jgi:hypothetical protein
LSGGTAALANTLLQVELALGGPVQEASPFVGSEDQGRPFRVLAVTNGHHVREVGSDLDAASTAPVA